MPTSVKDRLRKALIDAGIGELNDEMLDTVAGGNCSEGCYESCAACCTNGNANRLAEVVDVMGGRAGISNLG